MNNIFFFLPSDKLGFITSTACGVSCVTSISQRAAITLLGINRSDACVMCRLLEMQRPDPEFSGRMEWVSRRGKTRTPGTLLSSVLG